MSDNLTLEQIETDLKKMNKDLSKLRGYVSAHRDEMCSLASTNQLNKQFSKYLPAGYAFKRNYNVLGIRAIAGRNSAPEEEKPKMSIKKKDERPKRPRRIIQPVESSEESSEENSYEEEEYNERPKPKAKPKKERPKSHKKAKRKAEPEDEPEVESEEEPEDVKPAPKQTITPSAQPVPKYISNKNIARNHFKEKAWRLYHNIK